MPAPDIFLTILTVVSVALTLFAAHQINVREGRIAKLEDELMYARSERHRFAARAERLLSRYRAEYARANDAEARVLSRNIFDEVANEYAWLQFPDEPGAGASVYHYVDAELYDAALNSHEVK